MMTLKCYHRDTSTAEQNVQTNLSRQEYSIDRGNLKFQTIRSGFNF